jgi:WD40 repeat protein
MLATCSLDQKVILWKIEKEVPEKMFNLKDAPTCIAFHPELENIFVTGSLDQTIRRWSTDQSDKYLEEI